jgi:hypothetical protein
MVKSEGRSDILNNLINTMKINGKNYKYIIYDDACHINETVMKHKKIYEKLANIDFYIDKFHLRNHTRNVCKTKFNMKLNNEISHLNSEVCEQNFSLQLKHKYMVKHMTKNHYNFFLLCVYDKLNEIFFSKINK